MRRAPLLLIPLLVFSTTLYADVAKSTENTPGSKLYTVSRAVDGDTLELSNGERVRLIGVDTPESRDNPKLNRDAKRTGQDRSEIIKMGKEAAEVTRKLVEGKQVRLEYDVQKKDKYGRTLAYVYLEDGTFVNAEIVKAGYASPMTIPPDVKYAEVFQKLYREAREANRGLWKAEDSNAVKPGKPVTGYSWLKMTDAERLDYVMTSLYILTNQGVEYKGSPKAYMDAIGEKLDKSTDLYDANVTNILASVIYETEPGTREALDKIRK